VWQGPIQLLALMSYKMDFIRLDEKLYERKKYLEKQLLN